MDTSAQKGCPTAPLLTWVSKKFREWRAVRLGVGDVNEILECVLQFTSFGTSIYNCTSGTKLFQQPPMWTRLSYLTNVIPHD